MSFHSFLIKGQKSDANEEIYIALKKEKERYSDFMWIQQTKWKF